jgi:hypothetical protein
MADEESEESSVNKGTAYNHRYKKYPRYCILSKVISCFCVVFQGRKLKAFMNLFRPFYHVTSLSGKIPMSLKQCSGFGSRRTKMIQKNIKQFEMLDVLF